MNITDYHAKYYAHDLLRSSTEDGIEKISRSLFDAAVDLNPHQIEAALFALNSPLSKGVVLADEVGLGKTIEDALVLCQYWAERKRKLLIICPALNRLLRQSTSLQEKHDLEIKIKETEKVQRKQRQRIFDVEDEIEEKRNDLIEKLKKKLQQKTTSETLFTIRWRVV